MNPGQTFTKTWLVRNSGTCAWEAGFKLVFAGGDAMGGVTLVLQNPVTPGTEVELSIAMTAPTKNGTIRGDWRMATTTNTFFGDYVWIIIIVGGTIPTNTSTLTTETSTPTTTPTPTNTP
jgi:hypothetical protein